MVGADQVDRPETGMITRSAMSVPDRGSQAEHPGSASARVRHHRMSPLRRGIMDRPPLRAQASETRAMKFALATITLFTATMSALAPAAAQDYPSRPITLIVPYSAGGGNDLMARTAAEKMSKTLGQQIVIENRGGAGGSIATRQIAKSAPDSAAPARSRSIRRSTAMSATTRARISPRSASSPPAPWSYACTRRCRCARSPT